MQRHEAVRTALLKPIATLERDPSTLKPVADEIFAGYVRLYDYDPLPLDSRTDKVDTAPAHWTHEEVSIRAAYGNERVPVHLFLPKSASAAISGRDLHAGQRLRHAAFESEPVDAVARVPHQRRTRGGGTRYTRAPSNAEWPGRRDRMPHAILLVQRHQDLRRTVDYLSARKDVDPSRIAFYGLSLGAQLAPVALVAEPRLRTGVLLAGGFETWSLPPKWIRSISPRAYGNRY